MSSHVGCSHDTFQGTLTCQPLRGTRQTRRLVTTRRWPISCCRTIWTLCSKGVMILTEQPLLSDLYLLRVARRFLGAPGVLCFRSDSCMSAGTRLHQAAAGRIRSTWSCERGCYSPDVPCRRRSGEHQRRGRRLICRKGEAPGVGHALFHLCLPEGLRPCAAN